MATLERGLARLDREKLIPSLERGYEGIYAIIETYSVRRRKTELEPLARLAVQDSIDALSTEAHPPDAVQEGDSSWRAPASGTSCSIVYGIDGDKEIVTVFEIVVARASALPLEGSDVSD